MIFTGLDITITRRKNVVCPHCGEIVTQVDECSVDSGGRVWYPILESFGYYVPFEERTEENDWYSKDMTLTAEQSRELFRFVDREEVLHDERILELIARAEYEGHAVVINANW